MGTQATREAWLQPMIAQWTEGVERLATVAKRYPQTAFAGLARSLQSEWQYIQRVAPYTGHFFEPVEAVLRDTFLPALLGETKHVAPTVR